MEKDYYSCESNYFKMQIINYIYKLIYCYDEFLNENKTLYCKFLFSFTFEYYPQDYFKINKNNMVLGNRNKIYTSDMKCFQDFMN